MLICDSIPQHILDLAERLRSQDNRGTKHPSYCVQELERIYGLDDGDEWTWHNNDEDFREATPDEAKELDAKYDDGEDTGEWTKIKYRDDWHTVMAFLTLKGAEDYIANNGYNMERYGAPARIYVESFHRGEEMIRLREWLMTLKPLPKVEGETK